MGAYITPMHLFGVVELGRLVMLNGTIFELVCCSWKIGFGGL